MRAFLYTLTESEALPARIILMNGGVKLAVEGSDSLINLRRLAERGVEILACGTCLEFYQLKDALAVGRVSNMYEIAGLLLQGRTVRV
jgi:selenium metabolism protein YedF